MDQWRSGTFNIIGGQYIEPSWQKKKKKKKRRKWGFLGNWKGAGRDHVQSGPPFRIMYGTDE